MADPHPPPRSPSPLRRPTRRPSLPPSPASSRCTRGPSSASTSSTPTRAVAPTPSRQGRPGPRPHQPPLATGPAPSAHVQRPAGRDSSCGGFQRSRLHTKKTPKQWVLCSLKYSCLGVDPGEAMASRTTASPVYSSLTVSPAGEASVVVSSEQKVYDVVLKQAALLRRQLGPQQATQPAREMVEAMPRGGLKEAYGRCGEICEEYAKTFYLGTLLMTEERRRAIWAIYNHQPCPHFAWVAGLQLKCYSQFKKYESECGVGGPTSSWTGRTPRTSRRRRWTDGRRGSRISSRAALTTCSTPRSQTPSPSSL